MKDNITPLHGGNGTDGFLNDVMSADGGMEITTARDIQAMDFPPINYIVEPYIVEGLTIFAGKPKIGKSWLSLDIALGVAFGGVAMGSIEVDPGDVLYAALEDNPRRLKRRISQLLMEDVDWPDNLSFATSARRLDDGGLDDIARWADEAENPRLVIIDTFAKVRPVRSSKDSGYDADYAALTPLQQFAGERGLGVVLVHHLRKMEGDDPLDTVSGSTGLTGAADTVLVLARDSQGVVLHGRGRDIDEIEQAMQFDQTTGRWSILGDAADVRRSDERRAIQKAISAAGEPLSPSEIAAATGMKDANVRVLLHKMAKDGEVTKGGRGRYDNP